jgi:glycosyltransferase involved in cell wall biosynthesis
MPEKPAIKPRVSVVMPVRNGESHLAEAIESVRGQTLQSLELVVVDDGSEDDSAKIAERFAAADDRIRVVSQPDPRGISAALNLGWRLARGPYIARLDADDVALPDRLVRQADFLDQHPHVAVVGGAAIMIDDVGKRGRTVTYATDADVIRALLPYRNCFAHPATMIRRKAIEAVGGYRVDHVEDYDLWLRLAEHFELANLPDPVVLYRQHPGQVSLVALEEQALRRLVVRKAAQLRRASGFDPLEGADTVTSETARALGISGREVANAIEHEWYAWAAILAESGQTAAADRVTGLATAARGSRARRGVVAAIRLKRAEDAWVAGKMFRSVIHGVLAVFCSPTYALSRISSRMGALHRKHPRVFPSRTQHASPPVDEAHQG